MLTGTDPRRVGVLGAGLMGRGIAAVLAAAGHDVALYDVNAQVLDDAVGQLAHGGRLARPATSIEDAAGRADLVVEAIAEDLVLKQNLVTEVDRINPDAILATNTSVLPVTAIASRTTRPGRVVGTHGGTRRT